MTDIAVTLPGFSCKPFANILPSLERANIKIADILILEAVDVAKRATVPPREVRRFADALLADLHEDLGLISTPEKPRSARCRPYATLQPPPFVSLLDHDLDQVTGRIPVGYLTEITGESGAGKTQLLYTLLLAAQLPAPHGLGKTTLYISTEGSLQTTRLQQLLEHHEVLKNLSTCQKPTLSRVLSIKCPDLQTQDHILRYQLPVAIRRHDVGLVVVDSITANYRVEMERRGGRGFAERTLQLQETGRLLKTLAIEESCAIIVANQVSDRFSRENSSADLESGVLASQAPPASSAGSSNGTDGQLPSLTLDQQQKWFTGWGDMQLGVAHSQTLKTPSLGLVWSNQLSGRIVLVKAPSKRKDDGTFRTCRFVKPVFAPWAADASGSAGTEFIIDMQGLRTVPST